MSHFDAQAYCTQHYSSSNTADWEGMHERGGWPSAMCRLSVQQTPQEHGHGVVDSFLRACAPFNRTLDVLRTLLGGELTVSTCNQDNRP